MKTCPEICNKNMLYKVLMKSVTKKYHKNGKGFFPL